jgi:hypothetical protein
MLNLLIQLIILAVVLYLANLILDMMTLDARIKQIILVVLAIIGILWLFQGFSALPY